MRESNAAREGRKWGEPEWPEWERRLRAALCEANSDICPARYPPLHKVVRDAAAVWLGRRMWWCQDERQGWNNVAVVSSRVGRPRRELAPWLLALRATCRELDITRERLITSPGTTTHDWLERCHARWQLPLLHVDIPLREYSPPQWASHVVRANRQAIQSRMHDLVDYWFVSPNWGKPSAASRSDEEVTQIAGPLRDRVVMACADRIRILALRRGGNLRRLLESLGRLRLPRQAAWPEKAVEFFDETNFVPADVARELREWGARPWRPASEGEQVPVEARWGAGTRQCATISPTVWQPAPTDEGWLTHCTRAPHGPWPGQSRETYLDEWLLQPRTADYTALAALERILCERMLRASSRGIRGGTAVISFTEVPPGKLARLRVYRRHRLRWDFEPFALAIRRSWLVERGGRPVRYGDDALYRELDAGERPFFQRRLSERPETERQMDWSREREWRHVGDLPLDDLPRCAGRVLVPDVESARRVAICSRWPIAILCETPARCD